MEIQASIHFSRLKDAAVRCQVQWGPARIVKGASVKTPQGPIAQSIAQRRDVVSWSADTPFVSEQWRQNQAHVPHYCSETEL